MTRLPVWSGRPTCLTRSGPQVLQHVGKPSNAPLRKAVSHGLLPGGASIPASALCRSLPISTEAPCWRMESTPRRNGVGAAGWSRHRSRESTQCQRWNRHRIGTESAPRRRRMRRCCGDRRRHEVVDSAADYKLGPLRSAACPHRATRSIVTK